MMRFYKLIPEWIGSFERKELAECAKGEATLMDYEDFDEAKELELFQAWASTDIWLKYQDSVFFPESGIFDNPDMHQSWIVWRSCAKSRFEQ